MSHLGIASWGQGRTGEAIEIWEKALQIHRETNDIWGAAIALSYLGFVAFERGEMARAEELQRESLTLRWKTKNQEDIAHSLANVAMIISAGGDLARSARLFGAAQAIHEMIGHQLAEPERSIYQREIDALRGKMPPEEFEKSWAEGRSLSIELAVYQALQPATESATIETVNEIEPRPPSTFGLTDREIEVLQLMTEGMTDKEIGDALFISSRTAQGHVSHILGKLGVTTRSAAASMAVRAGLAGMEQ